MRPLQNRWKCIICEQRYASEAEAHLCEQSGDPGFRVGDTVQSRVNPAIRGRLTMFLEGHTKMRVAWMPKSGAADDYAVRTKHFRKLEADTKAVKPALEGAPRPREKRNSGRGDQRRSLARPEVPEMLEEYFDGDDVEDIESLAKEATRPARHSRDKSAVREKPFAHRCPVCRMGFHLKQDVARHLESYGRPDFGVGDSVLCIGSPTLIGKVVAIEADHRMMELTFTGRGTSKFVVRMFRKVTAENLSAESPAQDAGI